MLNFKEITLADREIIDSYLALDSKIMCDRSFTCLWLWHDVSNLQYCIKDGFIYFMGHWEEDMNNYAMPIGKGNIAPAIKEIIDDATSRQGDFSIYTISDDKVDNVRKILEESNLNFELLQDRDFFNYIYLADDLTNLTGKKYHAKRNFINRFKSTYKDRWEYKPLSQDDKDEILSFFKEWEKENIDYDPNEYKAEYRAVNRAFDDFDILKIIGGKLYVDGKLVAFTIASPQNDEALEIHFEKSLNIVGGYQMISNTFLLNLKDKYKYINKEEDMGLEGLRKSKLSLHPLYLSEEHVAICKNY